LLIGFFYGRFLIINASTAPTMAIAIMIATAATMMVDVLSGIAVSG
jgi:hypothetical protein